MPYRFKFERELMAIDVPKAKRAEKMVAIKNCHHFFAEKKKRRGWFFGLRTQDNKKSFITYRITRLSNVRKAHIKAVSVLTAYRITRLSN